MPDSRECRWNCDLFVGNSNVGTCAQFCKRTEIGEMCLYYQKGGPLYREVDKELPKVGETRLFLNFRDRQPVLTKELWTGALYDHDRPHWPLWQRAEAEACVERVRKAIGGGE